MKDYDVIVALLTELTVIALAPAFKNNFSISIRSKYMANSKSDMSLFDGACVEFYQNHIEVMVGKLKVIAI